MARTAHRGGVDCGTVLYSYSVEQQSEITGSEAQRLGGSEAQRLSRYSKTYWTRNTGTVLYGTRTADKQILWIATPMPPNARVS